MPETGFQAKLFQSLAALAEEVWILKDRQRVTEVVLARHGLDVTAEVDRLQPEGELASALETERKRFIAAVLGPFTAEDADGGA